MSRLKAARATERMREMLGVHGPCSELTACLVPLPLKPEVLLEGLLPQVKGLLCVGVGGGALGGGGSWRGRRLGEQTGVLRDWREGVWS